MGNRNVVTENLQIDTNWKKESVDMGTPSSTFYGFVEIVSVFGSNWNGTASTLTMAISKDAAGDKLLVTDIESTIYPGKTTSTAPNAGYMIGGPLAAPTNFLHFWFKVDAGTLDIDEFVITLRD